jgi:hypothetical protein
VRGGKCKNKGEKGIGRRKRREVEWNREEENGEKRRNGGERKWNGKGHFCPVVSA